nr:hypothetical protein [Tanacetum cinerariifolium]GEZ52517.1 hypothetical protein [Tanacetum cinerariifolium]
PIPAMPVPPAGQVLPSDVIDHHDAWVKASKEIIGLMLITMDPNIQKNLEQKEGQSVSSYVLKMKSYIDNLERLSHAMTQNLAVSLILVSLRKEYNSFVQNYNMHRMGKIVTELHTMLKLHEQTLPKKDDTPALHAIRAGKDHRESRKLKPRALNLYVGDAHRAGVEAIGSYHLYPKETMGYSFYYPPENKVLVARNVEFSLITQEASGSLEDLKIIQEEDTHLSVNTSLHHDEDDQEVDDLKDLVELPPNGKTVGSKWLFKKKTYMDGNVHTYKARLVAKGFTQTYEKILKRFHMENSKCGSIPMQDKPKLFKSLGTSTPAKNPGDLHWIAVKNVLKYLYNTKDMFLVYEGDIKRELKIKKFIFRLGIVPISEEPMKMYCDNTGAMAIPYEPGITKGARHYRTKVHYLREVIKFGDIKLVKVHTDDSLADPFTKALPFNKHSEHTMNIVLLPANNLM